MPKTLKREFHERGRRWQERHERYRQGSRGRGRRERSRKATR